MCCSYNHGNDNIKHQVEYFKNIRPDVNIIPVTFAGFDGEYVNKPNYAIDRFNKICREIHALTTSNKYPHITIYSPIFVDERISGDDVKKACNAPENKVEYHFFSSNFKPFSFANRLNEIPFANELVLCPNADGKWCQSKECIVCTSVKGLMNSLSNDVALGIADRTNITSIYSKWFPNNT